MSDFNNTILVKIENKKLAFTEGNLIRWHSFLERNNGKTIKITYERPVRSNQQNRLYWVFMEVISRETGDDPVSLHQYFKRAFLPPKFIKAMGKEIKIPSSTTELNKSDFSEYIMRIEQETGIACPDPKELENFIPNDKPYK